jgi:hypothetical protein
MAVRMKTKEGRIKFAETLISVGVKLYEGAFIGLVALTYWMASNWNEPVAIKASWPIVLYIGVGAILGEQLRAKGLKLYDDAHL